MQNDKNFKDVLYPKHRAPPLESVAEALVRFAIMNHILLKVRTLCPLGTGRGFGHINTAGLHAGSACGSNSPSVVPTQATKPTMT